jgi:hypothetical protein
MSILNKYLDLRSRVKNGYGWDQVSLSPAQFLELVDNLEVLEKENLRLNNSVTLLRLRLLLVDAFLPISFMPNLEPEERIMEFVKATNRSASSL